MKSRVSGFSHRALEVHITLFGMWIAGYWPMSDFGLVLKAWLGILAKFLNVFYLYHVRFDLCHPYIECLPMLYTARLESVELLHPICECITCWEYNKAETRGT